MRGFQQSLFNLGIPDKPINGCGESRAYSGAVMEEVMRGLFDLSPGIQNGLSSTCPDAYSKGRPVEIKSLKIRNKLVVYDWRLEKEAADTLYFIGIHNRKKASGSLRQIWEDTSKTLTKVMILPDWEIRQLAFQQDLQKIGTHRTKSGDRNGYQRVGYNRGYRNIPYTSLEDRCLELPVSVRTTIHGLHFSASVSMSHYLLCDGCERPESDIPYTGDPD